MGKHTLVHVNSKDIQHDIEKVHGITVPMYSVFCVERKFYNSHLWFEMWDDHEFINTKKEKIMTETNEIKSKKPELDETNSITGSQLIFFLIVFLGIVTIVLYMGSEYHKIDEKQKKEKERIELNGKTYIEE